MIPRLNMLIVMVLAFLLEGNAAPSFHVKCLEDLYKATRIALPEKMGACVDNDSTWQYAGKPLRICTNQYGDVSHIGYKLFDRGLLQSYEPRLFLDFIERYALEYELHRKGSYKEVDEVQFYVKFFKGSPALLSKIQPDTPLDLRMEEGKGFLLECTVGKQKLQMIVPIDYQLLKGANSAELESVFERDLARVPFRLVSDAVPDFWKNKPVSRVGDLLYMSNGYYLNEMIRSELYLYEAQGERRVWVDKKHPTRAVSTLLQTGCADQKIPLSLTLNKYGFKKEVLQTTLQQLVSYFQQENCELYVGFKNKVGGMLSASLYAFNKTLAYSHTVSLDFPLGLLDGAGGKVSAEIYTYIPLQNIARKFFIHSQNPKNRKK